MAATSEQIGELLATSQALQQQSVAAQLHQQQQLDAMKEMMNSFLATGMSTTTLGSRQVTIQEGKQLRELTQSFPKFAGDDFSMWKWKVENISTTRFGDMRAMLKWAEEMPDTIDFTQEHTVTSENYLPTFPLMSTYLYSAFAEKFEDVPLILTKNVGEQNGAEVWRRFCRRYQGKTFDKTSCTC